ncbi:MAG: OPT family oligopeptide transporter, partial [Candidatus Hinthialibacter sp.]
MSEANLQHNSSTGRPQREFTLFAVILGIILSLVMGAANVYLGLRAGMTVSASIPAAVISMGILQGIFRRQSILESNLVQTAASAGESLAAGIIFTMPAMILAGLWAEFDFWTTSLIAFTGGTLGILFMIPMRKVFVVDNKELKYPEGVACAAVLRAGDVSSDGQSSSSTGILIIMKGLLVGGTVKLLVSFLGLLKHSVEWAFYAANRVIYFGCDVSPALIAVGVVVGLPIAAQITLGGVIAWLIAIPMMAADPSSGSALDEGWRLWSTQVRYIGVGAMIVGGVVSIWRVRRGLVSAVTEMSAMMKNPNKREETNRLEENITGNMIFFMSLLCIILTAAVYYTLLHGLLAFTLLVTGIMIVMAFFFTAVASYIVGLVGNSNSPVSGMTISTILLTGGIIYLAGFSGTDGMIATLGVAGVICCVACTSGDVCNDLKTGYMIGASPRNQQIMQIIGVLAASFILAPIMTVLHEGSINNGTGGIGGRDLPAPQAVLFSSLVNGFFGDVSLPWSMVVWGVIIGFIILFIDILLERSESKFRLHIMPVAVGIYLPFGLSVPIFLGGLVHHFLKGRTAQESEDNRGRGV